MKKHWPVHQMFSYLLIKTPSLKGRGRQSCQGALKGSLPFIDLSFAK